MKKITIDKKTLKGIIRDIEKASDDFDRLGTGLGSVFPDEELTQYNDAEWLLMDIVKKLKSYL